MCCSPEWFLWYAVGCAVILPVYWWLRTWDFFLVSGFCSSALVYCTTWTTSASSWVFVSVQFSWHFSCGGVSARWRVLPNVVLTFAASSSSPGRCLGVFLIFAAPELPRGGAYTYCTKQWSPGILSSPPPRKVGGREAKVCAGACGTFAVGAGRPLGMGFSF